MGTRWDIKVCRTGRGALRAGDLYGKLTGVGPTRTHFYDAEVLLMKQDGTLTEAGWRSAALLVSQPGLTEIQRAALSWVNSSPVSYGPRRGTCMVLAGKAWEVYEPSRYEAGSLVQPAVLRRRCGEEVMVAYDL